MPTMNEEMTRVTDRAPDETRVPEVPEVEVRGDEAVIRAGGPDILEERKVKLPRTTWA